MEISLKKAALINAISRYISIMLGIGFTMILARILTPDDYGIVAVIIVFTNFFAIFADMGISNGIIQYKKLTDEDLAGIFSLTGVLGVILGGIFFVFSFGIADFYRNAVYVPLGGVLSVNLMLSTWNIVPNALMLKDKQFILLAKRNVWIPFFTSTITVFMAWSGMAYYALVLQSLLTSLIMLVYNWYTTRRKYGLYILWDLRFDGLRKIFGYSAYQFLFSIINYFARNLDNLLIGRVWGASALGFYDKAYRLMCYPIGSLTHVITPVLQPILSDYQNDKTYIYNRYVKVIKFLSLLGIFMASVCYFLGDEIILIMFGAQWENAIPYFKWLSLAVWAQIILGTTGSIFQSSGDTRNLFITGCITTLMNVIAIILGVLSESLEDVARNVMISYNVQFILVMYILINLTLKQSYKNFLKKFIPELIITIILTVVMNVIIPHINQLSFVELIVVKVMTIMILFYLGCKFLGQWQYLLLLKK